MAINLKARFSVRRMVGLGRLALADEWRPFLWIGMIFFVLTFLSSLTVFRFSPDFLFKLMLLAGIMFVSRAFADIRQKERGTYVFMIPASVEEKFLIRLLGTLVGFYLLSVLVFYLAAGAGNFVSYYLLDQVGLDRQPPTDLLDSFAVFTFFHALFFAGALLFRKNNFFKTTLVLIAGFFVLLFSAGHYLKSSFMHGRHQQFQFYFDMEDGWQGLFPGSSSTFTLIKWFLLVIVPLSLYGLSYLLFKNTQIKK